MISNVNDMSVLMSALKSSGDHGLEQTQLMSIIEEKYNYIEWRYDPVTVLDVANKLALIEINDGVVKLTNNGHVVASMGGHNIDFTDDQIGYIAEHCVFNNPNFSDLMDFLSLFVFNSHRKTLVYNTADYPSPDVETDLFVQLGILSKDHYIFTLDPKYVMHVTHSHNNVFGSDHLEEVLADQKAVGDMGEVLSLNYEKNRLASLGLTAESESVVRISLTDVAAGYDIKSFAGMSPALRHDLFVEVKARKRNLPSFIMSANEIRVAKRLGCRYVIHFWAGLAHHKPEVPTMIIRDPVQALSIEECPSCISYLITVSKGV